MRPAIGQKLKKLSIPNLRNAISIVVNSRFSDELKRVFLFLPAIIDPNFEGWHLAAHDDMTQKSEGMPLSESYTAICFTKTG